MARWQQALLAGATGAVVLLGVGAALGPGSGGGAAEQQLSLARGVTESGRGPDDAAAGHAAAEAAEEATVTELAQEVAADKAAADEASAQSVADAAAAGQAAAAAAAQEAAEAGAEEEHTRQAEQDAALDPRFDTCTAALAQGHGHYAAGLDPEYPWYRDADSDGIVCQG